jgi:hypothetical protein
LSEYRIFETAEFRRRLAGLAAPDAEFIKKKLLSHIYPQLRHAPFFGPSIKKSRDIVPRRGDTGSGVSGFSTRWIKKNTSYSC